MKQRLLLFLLAAALLTAGVSAAFSGGGLVDVLAQVEPDPVLSGTQVPPEQAGVTFQPISSDSEMSQSKI